MPFELFHFVTKDETCTLAVTITFQSDAAKSVRLSGLFRNKCGAKAQQRPVSFKFDFVDVGEVARLVRPDGVAGGVALLVAVEAQFERLRFAPFRVKDRADEVEDGGRADGQAIALRQETARVPVFINDA